MIQLTKWRDRADIYVTLRDPMLHLCTIEKYMYTKRKGKCGLHLGAFSNTSAKANNYYFFILFNNFLWVCLHNLYFHGF